MIAAIFAFPSFQTFTHKEPNSSKRSDAVQPPRIDENLRAGCSYNDEGEPTARNPFDRVYARRPALQSRRTAEVENARSAGS